MIIALEVSDIDWHRLEVFANANSYTLEKAIARKLKFHVLKVAVMEKEPIKVASTPQIKRQYRRKKVAVT